MAVRILVYKGDWEWLNKTLSQSGVTKENPIVTPNGKITEVSGVVLTNSEDEGG